ncbi:MAG: glycine reductase [Clostridiales bacterium]|nr:glycine reductase [Clostridiales bacterium]
MSNTIEKMIAQTFLDISKGLETGSFSKKPHLLLTGIGSEHGEEEMMKGALMAAGTGIEVTYVGTLSHEKVTTLYADNEDQAHKIMEQMLQKGEVDGAVTMHYPFPIGVSTVGNVITPGRGKELLIATTTGTSATNRVEGMVKNALAGVIAAKACGNPSPTIGILNIDGARQCEIALKELQAGGYPLQFATSSRADGGSIMRGNDLLTGSCDIMVTDPLTGNVLTKMLSSFTSGGSYESLGSGYGPGIGKNQKELVMIVSRASGAPVIAGALAYGAKLVAGNWLAVIHQEYEAAEKAGLKTILEKIQSKEKSVGKEKEEPISSPPKTIVTEEIAGIEITDLEEAVFSLWKAGIYAESGMGCTGPVVLVNESLIEKARALLTTEGWISQE